MTKQPEITRYQLWGMSIGLTVAHDQRVGLIERDRGRDQDFLDLSQQGKTAIRWLPNHGILSELFSL